MISKRLPLATALCLFFAVPALSADFQVGVEAYKKGDYDLALKHFKPLALTGDPDAQNNMGVLFETGHGVQKSSHEALRWYRKAAEQGHPSAQNYVGTAYFKGTGVVKDDAEALKWFRKAASQGLPEAMNNVGVMYATGRGVNRDSQEADRWFKRSVEQAKAKKAAEMQQERTARPEHPEKSGGKAKTGKVAATTITDTSESPSSALDQSEAAPSININLDQGGVTMEMNTATDSNKGKK